MSQQTTTIAPEMRGISQSTDTGVTRIAEAVVAKIAGLAARDIPGVYSMGSGLERRVGQLKSMVSSSGTATAMQGVSVEVHESDARVDLDIVTWYGQSIADISDTVRRNVIGQIESMTGLGVSEVNIQVNDIHVDGDQPTSGDMNSSGQGSSGQGSSGQGSGGQVSGGQGSGRNADRG